MSEEKVFRLSLDVIWMRIIPESVINLENNLPIGLQTLVESNREKQRLLRNFHSLINYVTSDFVRTIEF